MSIDANKALVSRFFAAIKSDELKVFDEIVADGYKDHLPATAELILGTRMEFNPNQSKRFIN